MTKRARLLDKIDRDCNPTPENIALVCRCLVSHFGTPGMEAVYWLRGRWEWKADQPENGRMLVRNTRHGKDLYGRLRLEGLRADMTLDGIEEAVRWELVAIGTALSKAIMEASPAQIAWMSEQGGWVDPDGPPWDPISTVPEKWRRPCKAA